MRSGSWMRRLKVVVLVLCLMLAAMGWYGMHLPGRSFTGPEPAVTPTELSLASRLRVHVQAIASTPHNLNKYPQELEAAADYIGGVLSSYGYRPQPQIFEVGGKQVRNIAVTLNASGTAPPKRTIVIGAHYDSFDDAPGACDNGTGTAAIIELARLLADLKTADTRIIFVLFVNEEPPYFQTPNMGSVHFAKLLADRGEPVAAMLSLETIGYFSDQPGSQNYPTPLNKVFPTTANFIAFVAITGSRDLLQKVVGSFRRTTAVPSIGGVAPGWIEGVGWSDHWSFARMGFQALMVTDTAVFRNPNYHKPTDTAEKVDFDKLARVTLGLAQAIRDLANNGF